MHHILFRRTGAQVGTGRGLYGDLKNWHGHFYAVPNPNFCVSIDRWIIHVNVFTAQQIFMWGKWLRQDETGLEDGKKKRRTSAYKDLETSWIER